MVDDGSGNFKPIYNAIPVSFSLGGVGFIDPFDGSQPLPWTPLVPGGDNFETWDYSGSWEFRQETSTGHVGSLNGCGAWTDYTIQANVLREPGAFPFGDFFGLILRHQDQNNYYWFRVTELGTSKLYVGKRVAGVDIDISVPNPFIMAANTTYTFKAQVEGNQIRAKFWGAFVDPLYDPADPGATEPVAWDIVETDGTFSSGKFGVESVDWKSRFDNLSVDAVP
jgi:hypothetical protein